MTLPSTIGVYGGGRMGAGIAHAFLIGGSDVVVVETDDSAGAAALGRVEASLAQARERGIEAAGSLLVTTDAADLGCAELVIEAVPELPDLKHEVLATVEGSAPDAVLATNTSSLSIDELASRLQRPGRFIGLHFFNPVPASDLVEVVVGAQTGADLVVRSQDWVAGLGKTAVVVNDAPGFASSRLGVAIALEAMRMLEEGVASAEDIDNAMVLGYKHPTGPLKTTDIVGLDVRLGIAEYLHEQLGERFAPPAILRAKVEAGDLGRKTGKGFYDWS
jgi:3-hydroxybutyryl-CoA dehydrogenase